MDKFREECGLFGIFGHPEASNMTYLGLYALQHRGQESAGIAASDGQDVRVSIGMGHVADVFNNDVLSRLPGDMAFGHVRYSTAGFADHPGGDARGGRRLQHFGDCVGLADTSTRDADSPKSAAASFSRAERDTLVPSMEAWAPIPCVLKQHSARATASPPSAQSCADRIHGVPPGHEQLLEGALAPQIERRRRAGDPPAQHLEILAAAQFSVPLAEEHDDIARLAESSLEHPIRMLEEPDDADDGRRVDGSPVGLVVEADVAAGDRHVERATGLADALDGLRELPHDVRPFRVAEIQAVGDRHRPCPGARHVARGFGHREHRPPLGSR